MEITTAFKPHPQETQCGDLATGWTQKERTLLFLADGLGHGREAKQAAEQAHHFVAKHQNMTLKDLFSACDQRLRHSRGVAMVLAVVEPAKKELTLCGVGSVRAQIITPQKQTLCNMTPGIVGGGLPPLKPKIYPLPKDALILLCSDGLNALDHLALLNRYPQHNLHHMAQAILAQYAVDFDDATVLLCDPWRDDSNEQLKTDYYTQYTKILESYLLTPQESNLSQAASLGSSMVQANFPPEEIGALQEYALASIQQHHKDLLQHAWKKISTPLMEVLMAYGMAFRAQVEKRHAKKVKKEYREGIRQLFQVSEVMHLLVDPYHRQILDMNQSAAQFLGRDTTHSGVIALDKIVVPGNNHASLNQILRYITAPRPNTFTTQFYDADKQPRLVRIQVSPVSILDNLFSSWNFQPL
ncbi:SpoIIE family protein phosphatase [Magnetococcales bacterium HHB-1]